jgi:hypothetical protein
MLRDIVMGKSDLTGSPLIVTGERRRVALVLFLVVVGVEELYPMQWLDPVTLGSKLPPHSLVLSVGQLDEPSPDLRIYI